MDGRTLLTQLRRQIPYEGPGEPTDIALAAYLGLKPARLAQIKASPMLSALQVSRLFASRGLALRAQMNRELVRTVVEFFPIDNALNDRGGVSIELFNAANHPYRIGLKAELEAARGVYIFYDSRGRALYAGKAKDQSLWKEMRLAFNRDRGEVQSLARVQHPDRKVPFRRAEEKRRQIVTREVPLHELASYFSAYSVDRDATDSLEALLIRAFPNDLLNKKRESLSKVAKK